MTASFHILDRLRGQPCVVACSEVLSRLDYIDQMMRHTAPLRMRHFCGSDVDTAIDLNRIQIYDLAVERLSQLYAEVAFSGSRRTYDYRDHL